MHENNAANFLEIRLSASILPPFYIKKRQQLHPLQYKIHHNHTTVTIQKNLMYKPTNFIDVTTADAIFTFSSFGLIP